MSSFVAMAWLVNPSATRSKISTWRGVSRAKRSASVLRDFSASCRWLFDRGQERVGRLVGLDQVAEYAKHFTERMAHGSLIVDEKDDLGRHGQLPCERSSGTEKRNSVAFGSPDCSQTRPPWAS